MLTIKGDRVIGHMGDVLAEKINGVWESKEQHVLDFVKSQEEKPKAVRARTSEGQFIPDDPKTPEVNEAWTFKKPSKKSKKKK